MNTGDMKNIERRIVNEAFNQGNLDMLPEVLSADYVLHNNGDEDLEGIDAMKQFIAGSRDPFPDLEITIDDMYVADDSVISRWTSKMTHENEFMNIPPTGKQVEVQGVTITRCADGKAIETWHYSNRLGLLQQLGVL